MEGQWNASKLSRCCPSGEHVFAQFLLLSFVWVTSVEIITAAWNKAVRKKEIFIMIHSKICYVA